MSPSLVLCILAMWGSMGRCGGTGTPGPLCDNGKLSVEKDLPQDAVWVCPVSPWPESVQQHPSVDTKYDPEPTRMVCMDKPISYNHRLPNSGAYRPVRAESGEYLYCPPQRWLNNLHHGATVLLYHPCAPLHERVHLSILAHSCLTNYIITPHPGLRKHRPIALLSWGCTLELSAVTALAVCDWLETTPTGSKRSDLSQTRKYNHLLIRSAEQHAREPERQNTLLYRHLSTSTKQSVRHCCEQTLLDAETHTRRRRSRDERADEHKQLGSKLPVRSSPSNDTGGTVPGGTRPGEVQKRTNTFGTAAAASGDPLIADSPVLRESSPISGSELPSPGTAVGLNTSGITLKEQSTDVVNRKDTDSTEDKKTHGVKQKALTVDNVAGDKMKDSELVDVKERQLENKPTSNTPSDKTGPESNPATQPASHLSRAPECGSCNLDGTKASGPQGRAALLSRGLVRTNDAVWAALAVGFLLVLLALSVLHTRLYRHWRTPPSLYWDEPRQDYDTVADVIRQRLRMARRKRRASKSRRQERALLPNSSDSDES